MGFPAEHVDYGGDPAFVWGMNFRVADAAECCEACIAHQETCADVSTKGTKFWEPSISGAGHCGGHMLQVPIILQFTLSVFNHSVPAL